MSKKCPLCEKDQHVEFAPFCSKRCKLVDLGRWVQGDYKIPTDENAESDEGGQSL